MDSKRQIIAAYKIFGSPNRGTDEVEKLVAAIIAQKETDENLSLFASKIEVEWRCTEENISCLKKAFADFDDKMEVGRSDMARSLAFKNSKPLKIAANKRMAFK